MYPNNLTERPGHGTQELCQLFVDISVPTGPHQGEPLLAVAANNVPDADVKLVEKVTGKKQDPKEMRCHLALNNLCNAICNKCLDKRDLLKLGLCDHCCLTWYCSERCRVADWETHRLRCGRRDGPLDQGPMKLIFAEIE